MLIAQRVRCDDTLCPDFAANCGDERPQEFKAQISHVRPQKNRGDLFEVSKLTETQILVLFRESTCANKNSTTPDSVKVM